MSRAANKLNGHVANRFDKLLEQLGEEHVDQIRQLRLEIQRLQGAVHASPTGSKLDVLKLEESNVENDHHNGHESDSLEELQAETALPPLPNWHSRTTMEGSAGVSLSTPSKSFMRFFELKEEWDMDPPVAHHWQEVDQSLHYYGRTTDQYDRFVRQRSKAAVALTDVKTAYVISPVSPFRVGWDIAGLILIGYDMLTIPFFLAYEPEETFLTAALGWLTLFFWTLDMFASGLTGYYKDGRLIMNLRLIWCHYLKGWFLLDCIVVVPDWIMKVMGSMTNAAGLGRILRITRVMRVFRLLRLLKLNKLVGMIYDMIDSEHMFIVFDLVKMLSVIMFLNHVVACAWYLIGRLSVENNAPRNWLQYVGMTPVWDAGLSWKYLTSLHWSITQFTPASMDVWATNVPERVFSIAVLFWALVALSSIIGNVTASMTAIRNMSVEQTKQFWLLRKYMNQQKIPRSLSSRIMKFLEHQCQMNYRMVSRSSVRLLDKISTQLQSELAHTMFSAFMEQHPLMNWLCVEYPTLNFRLCEKALRCNALAKEDVAFHPGAVAESAYFVKLGEFVYRNSSGRPSQDMLEEYGWASEAILWTVWRHRGYLIARCESELLVLSPHIFGETMRMHPGPWNFSRNYAGLYVKLLNELRRDQLSDVMFDADIAFSAFQAVKEGVSFQLPGTLAEATEMCPELVLSQKHLHAEANLVQQDGEKLSL